MGVRTDGVVKANEEFSAWLANERSMPFGADGEHVTVRLIDVEDIERNQYVVTAQYTVRSGANGALPRADRGRTRPVSICAETFPNLKPPTDSADAAGRCS